LKCEEFQVLCELLQKFLSANPQCWNDLSVLPTASLFWFSTFILERSYFVFLCLW